MIANWGALPLAILTYFSLNHLITNFIHPYIAPALPQYTPHKIKNKKKNNSSITLKPKAYCNSTALGPATSNLLNPQPSLSPNQSILANPIALLNQLPILYLPNTIPSLYPP